MVASELINIATDKNMRNKDFLKDIEFKLTQDGVSEETVRYVIGKMKQSYKNGVWYGQRKGSKEKAAQ